MLHRDDLNLEFLSDSIDAFRFDFAQQSTFLGESKQIQVRILRSGICYGLIQWLKIELDADNHFENHPLERNIASGWQHSIFRPASPIAFKAGEIALVNVSHNRNCLWMNLVAPD